VLAALAALTAELEAVVVVVRPGQRQLQALLRGAAGSADAAILVSPCPRAEQGMGHSIACGVAASRQAEGWIIALADMPWVRARTIGRLRDALAGGAALAAPTHAGRRGNPVGFSRAYRDELLALRGDRGARGILARDQAVLSSVECEDPGVLRDVDTPAALRPRR
jgi:molybdenum cofactor cytidylyltransferase